MDAEQVLKELCEDLKYRLENIDARNGAYWLVENELKASYLIQFSYAHVLRAIERRGTLVEVSSSIGRRLRQKMKLPQDSVAEIHAGWFVLISFIDTGLVSYTKEKTVKNTRVSKHRSYVINAEDWPKLKMLMETVDSENCDMFPVPSAPSPWVKGYPYHYTTGTPIVKKGFAAQLDPFKDPEAKTDMLFEVLNKLSQTGWRINKPVFEVYTHFLSEKGGNSSPFKFAKETDPKKKKSMMIEAEAVNRMAKKHLDNAFYHLYNFDFRGRIYPNTAFLHEQSSDNAKGILMLDQPELLGEDGLDWLYYHAANCWGEDKLPKKERIQWGRDHMDMMGEIVIDPTKDLRWHDAEKPFSFLAVAYELYSVSRWVLDGNTADSFPSCLPVFIDGSNNGVQHLTAMSKDEEVAPLVNLVPQDKPGDVYMFIAEKAWDRIEDMYDDLNEETRKKFGKIFIEGNKLQTEYSEAPLGSSRKAMAYEKLSKWKQTNRHLREKLFPAYWRNVVDPKLRRKTVKRNTMTLGYGGTAYGMGQQIIEDTRGLSDFLRDKDYLWGIMMGNLVYDTCYQELKGPAKMLRLFETLAERANDENIPLRWTTPITHFPVVQEYRKAKPVRVRLRHGSDDLWVQIQVWEESTLNENKQKTGAAPNIVHSLDAVHLAMTVHYCDFNVVVVHDSFGCGAGNMSKLFTGVRQTFVNLYKEDPLRMILESLESLDLYPEMGELDIEEIMKSDFAFA